ncbi:unnamed protein product [Prunus armeniaca]
MLDTHEWMKLAAVGNFGFRGPNPLSCKKKKTQKNPDLQYKTLKFHAGKDGDTTLRSRKKRNRSQKGKRLKVLKFGQLSPIKSQQSTYYDTCRHHEQLRPMQPLKNAASMTEV